MRPLLIANWKMNGAGGLAQSLCQHLVNLGPTDAKMIACVPYVYLPLAQSLFCKSAVALGAQDVSAYAIGAHTGEVSAAMLKEFGCSYVIVGHSERRAMGEASDLVAAKAHAVIDAGMTPIICVGESKEAYDAGETETMLMEQLLPVFANHGHLILKSSVLAYEPVWAIGGGLAASVEVITEVHAFIRKWCQDYDNDDGSRCPIVYGGSVNPSNLEAVLAIEHVNGVLVGGASLKVDQWSDMVCTCKR
jgi:triosephosphate isomerase